MWLYRWGRWYAPLSLFMLSCLLLIHVASLIFLVLQHQPVSVNHYWPQINFSFMWTRTQKRCWKHYDYKGILILGFSKKWTDQLRQRIQWTYSLANWHNMLEILPLTFWSCWHSDVLQLVQRYFHQVKGLESSDFQLRILVWWSRVNMLVSCKCK